MPRTSGSFDFFGGGTLETGGSALGLCGNGGLGLGGNCAVCVGGNGALGFCGEGVVCVGGGNGALEGGGLGGTLAGMGGMLSDDNGALAGVSVGGVAVCCCWCKFADVGEPVGPVFLGSTAVGADEVVAMVALKSGGGAAGFSFGGSAEGVR